MQIAYSEDEGAEVGGVLFADTFTEVSEVGDDFDWCTGDKEGIRREEDWNRLRAYSSTDIQWCK